MTLPRVKAKLYQYEIEGYDNKLEKFIFKEVFTEESVGYVIGIIQKANQ